MARPLVRTVDGSRGGETAWTTTSQPPASAFAPKWAKLGRDWQERGKWKARPQRGVGNASPGWNLDHHQQTLMKRSHSTIPDMLAPFTGRQGHRIYSNTGQPCKGLHVPQPSHLWKMLKSWHVPMRCRHQPKPDPGSALPWAWEETGKVGKLHIISLQNSFK